MNGTERAWLYVREDEQENLFRIRFIGERGKVRIPRVGSFNYVRDQEGKISILSERKKVKIFVFQDGAVLFRRRNLVNPKPVTLQKRKSIGLCLFVLFVSFHIVAQIHARQRTPKDKSNVATTSTSKSGPTRIEVTKTPQIEKELETKARRQFLKGDFSAARDLLLDLKKKHNGTWPTWVRPLVAEIEYAQCRQAFAKEKWILSVRSCEEAVFINSHAQAKQLLTRLDALARKYYLEGYAMEESNSNEALRRYREVLAMASSVSPYRKKAKEKLNGFKEIRSD